jgi:hypothetical protein
VFGGVVVDLVGGREGSREELVGGPDRVALVVDKMTRPGEAELDVEKVGQPNGVEQGVQPFSQAVLPPREDVFRLSSA